MKILKKTLFILLLLCLSLAAFIGYHLHTDAVISTEEIIPADEQQQIQLAADNFIAIIQKTHQDYAARGAHAKGHACVKAYFDINADIDPRLQYGVFSQADTRYKTWIRFSNGGSNMAKDDDRDKDSRGMAIKLFALDDDSIIKTQQPPLSQDFLAHNSPAFFSVDLNDYNQLVTSEDKISYFLSGYNPFKWRLRELSHVVDTLAKPPASPISDDYFSNTAYKLGPNNIKFMIRACENEIIQKHDVVQDKHFLATTLATELSSSSQCMEFLVQLQDPDKNMPIEDVSILWQQKDSPFIPVATITILKQQFDSTQQQQFCENMSFSPWNALEQHRPIGALNRARKLVYQMSSDYRHKTNKTSVPQALDW